MRIEPILQQVQLAEEIRSRYLAESNQWREAANFTISVDNWALLCWNISLQAALGAFGAGLAGFLGARLEQAVFFRYVLKPIPGSAGGFVASGNTARLSGQLCQVFGGFASNVIVGGVAFALDKDKSLKNAAYSFLTGALGVRWKKITSTLNAIFKGGPALLSLETLYELAEAPDTAANPTSAQIQKAAMKARQTAEEAMIQLFAAQAQAVNDMANQQTPVVMRNVKDNAPKYKLSLFSSVWGRQEELDMFLRFHVQSWAAFNLWHRVRMFQVDLYNYSQKVVEGIRSGVISESEVRMAYAIVNRQFSLSRSRGSH